MNGEEESIEAQKAFPFWNKEMFVSQVG